MCSLLGKEEKKSITNSRGCFGSHRVFYIPRLLVEESSPCYKNIQMSTYLDASKSSAMYLSRPRGDEVTLEPHDFILQICTLLE